MNKEDYIQFLAEGQLCMREVNHTPDPEFNIDGLAIVASKKLMENSISQIHRILHISATRNAQMLTITTNEVKIHIINVHLHHPPDEEIIRVHQIWSIMKWIDMNTNSDDLIVMLGDFNCEPNSATYEAIICHGYISSHMAVHNCEPINTFHNRMDAPFKDDAPDGTFDYIL